MPEFDQSEIEKFVETVAYLRHPEHGCPWDLEQTHASLKRYMLEESYEALEAIDQVAEFEDGLELVNADTLKAKLANLPADTINPYAELKEELGDLLLQILLHSQIASEAGQFNFEDVAKACNDKMRVRHPHVFDDAVAKAENVDDVHKNWDAAKAKEKSKRKSIFDGIPTAMPALARAWKISKKAVKESFEWDTEEQLWEQLESEILEFKEASAEMKKLKASSNANEATLEAIKSDMELEIGDILFTAVNVARWFQIDPEDALRRCNNKFVARFNRMVEITKSQNPETKLSDYNSDELLRLWQEAKKSLSTSF